MKNFEKIKKFIGLVIGVFVLVIGVCMVVRFELHTPPFMSGLAFILIGFSMWLKNCMMLDYFCSKNCEK